MRTILSTGIRAGAGSLRARRGFTFFEVMVAVAVFATGITMIYRALIFSLDLQTHLVHRLYVNNLLDDELAVFRQELGQTADPLLVQSSRSRDVAVVLNNRPVVFRLSFAVEPVAGLPDLLAVRLVINWDERGRVVTLSRATYCLHDEEEG